MATDFAITVAEPIEAEEPSAAPQPRLQRWDLLRHLDKGVIGRRGADAAVTVERSEAAGCVLYGPYWQLPAGVYRLSFACRVVGKPRFAGQPVLGAEAIVLNRIQQGWRDFTVAELAGGSGSLVFKVSDQVSREAGNEGRFEFRFFHFGNAGFEIGAVELTRLEPEDAPPLPARRWRMLGRLQKTWRGRRHPDGQVAVARLSPPGCLLYGGWPYLRLARGRYRLTVAARADGPRDTNGPVLGVEILGYSRWRDGGLWRASLHPAAPRGIERVSREFSAADLAGAEAAIEFAVPTEISVDSGVDAPFEIRLFHRGNAGLAIDAIDLVRLDESEGDHPEDAGSLALPMPALHPAGRKNVVIIGNCQSEIVRQGFTRVESLNAQFKATYHFVTLPSNLHEFARRDLEACDILLVQDIRDWANFPLRDAIPPGVEEIRFPGVRFGSLWPFDSWNGPGDNEAYRREAPNLTFPYLDGLLARLRNEIPDPEQRFAAYRALDFPGIVNYRRLHDFEIRRLLATDEKFGIGIGAYVLEHFQKRRLFHTTVRPNRQVLDMLMHYILGRIGVRGRHPLPEHVEGLLRNPQVPVHPKVARDLGVRWADENTRYLNRGMEVTWETYIRSYIAHYG